MCGVVGLFLKTESRASELGAMTAEMLAALEDRGPDSAGVALYSEAEGEAIKLTLRAKGSADWDNLARAVEAADTSASLTPRQSHAVVRAPVEDAGRVGAVIEALRPQVEIVARGRAMEIYKDVGRPQDVARSFGLHSMGGTHAIGHTRMATESAVTTNGAHPFSTGQDQCLIHNGSLSNHNNVRRKLQRDGVHFESENDTEVAAAYLSHRMENGRSLGEALDDSLKDLDGFYTFVVATRTGFGVLRDPIACKPAVLAETDDYVAIASEYRAMAMLPAIERARVWEPEPATSYFWTR